MTITLQPEQEQFIQAQLATGCYTNAIEAIAEALLLLEKCNDCDRWTENRQCNSTHPHPKYALPKNRDINYPMPNPPPHPTTRG
jgi:Arc/MetJ-type ribon-helix-helix transcriptional regulator